MSESKLRYCHRLIFGTIAFLLAIVVALELCGVRSSNTRIGMLSLAMGMMNPALSKIGAESVSLTFVTGTLSRIGVHLASAAVRKPLVLDEGRADSHLARARIDAIIWAGFLVGAGLSGVACSYFHLWALLPPCVVMIALALFSESVMPLPERKMTSIPGAGGTAKSMTMDDPG